MRIQPMTLNAGKDFPAHSHDVDKVLIGVSGCLEVFVNGKPIILHRGQSIMFPAGVSHGARVLGEFGASVVEITL